MPMKPRPDLDEYKMALAVEVASRSNCLKAHVGAILLLDDRIRAVGYNGTAEGTTNCFDGGCERCRDMKLVRGEALDRCTCVHAEENALISAARYGIPVDGVECYVTHEPCLGCTKLLIQAHLSRVVYLKVYEHPNTSDQNESRRRLREHPLTKTRFERFDPKGERVKEWEGRLDAMKQADLDHGDRMGILIKMSSEPSPPREPPRG